MSPQSNLHSQLSFQNNELPSLSYGYRQTLHRGPSRDTGQSSHPFHAWPLQSRRRDSSEDKSSIYHSYHTEETAVWISTISSPRKSPTYPVSRHPPPAPRSSVIQLQRHPNHRAHNSQYLRASHRHLAIHSRRSINTFCSDHRPRLELRTSHSGHQHNLSR